MIICIVLPYSYSAKFTFILAVTPRAAVDRKIHNNLFQIFGRSTSDSNISLSRKHSGTPSKVSSLQQ